MQSELIKQEKVCMTRESDFRKKPAEIPAALLRSAETLPNAESIAPRDTDSYGFSFESLEDFSESPLEFEEYASVLLDDLSDTYSLTGMYNRYSPNYLTACGLMEKIIRRLGSCCVTKAVLEQKGFSFKKLDRLTVDGLYGCVSFNFRKCHAALQGGKEKNIFDFRLLNLECRLYELADRLRSTGEKIRRIRDGKVNADWMLERESVFAAGKPAGKAHPSVAAYRGAPSFPLLGSVAREMLRKSRPERSTPAPAAARPFYSARVFSPVTPEEMVKEHEKIRAELYADEEPVKKAEKAKPVWTSDEERDAIIRQSWERLARLATPKNKKPEAGDPPAAPKHPEKHKKKKKR